MGRIRTILLIVLLALPSTTACAFDDHPRFEVDVRPILKAHCWQCHGEEKELHGGMDARLVQFLLKGANQEPRLLWEITLQVSCISGWLRARCRPARRKFLRRSWAQVAKWIDAGAMTVRTEPERLPSVIRSRMKSVNIGRFCPF